MCKFFLSNNSNLFEDGLNYNEESISSRIDPRIEIRLEERERTRRRSQKGWDSRFYVVDSGPLSILAFSLPLTKTSNPFSVINWISDLLFSGPHNTTACRVDGVRLFAPFLFWVCNPTTTSSEYDLTGKYPRGDEETETGTQVDVRLPIQIKFKLCLLYRLWALCWLYLYTIILVLQMRRINRSERDIIMSKIVLALRIARDPNFSKFDSSKPK